MAVRQFGMNALPIRPSDSTERRRVGRSLITPVAVLAGSSSSLTTGHPDRRNHIRCKQADRLVIHGVHGFDDEVLDSSID
jgi:hypothetical protein